MEDYLLQSRPDAVIVYGDTNSTVGACLAAAKLGQFVVHVEAGLRSYNRAMPEEINRVAVDHLADLLCAPTRQAMTNLETEGLSRRAVLTGDVMVDALEHNLARARSVSRIVESCGLQAGKYAVATIHRAENTEEGRLQQLVEIVRSVSADIVPVVFPVHPRTAHRIPEALTGAESRSDRLQISQPLGYLDMIQLMAHAAVVITDSGGMQKEAFYLGVPCVTLRSETEWPETVDCGANVLVGANRTRILEEVRRAMTLDGTGRRAFAAAARDRYGSGVAGKTIVTAMVEKLAHSRRATGAG
jgi:UDP-N-acetylglucosamine 2-epimerase